MHSGGGVLGSAGAGADGPLCPFSAHDGPGTGARGGGPVDEELGRVIGFTYELACPDLEYYNRPRPILSRARVPIAPDSRGRTTLTDTAIALGYAVFNAVNLAGAIAVMRVAVQDNPRYWNADDSLGEMYANAGDRLRAIENYERSVQLNPQNTGGIEALRKLRAKS